MTNLGAPGAGGDQAPAPGGIEVLKALADPVRLSMLYTLTRSAGGELPVMSVKELASALGEPQTKLYRHVKNLEAAGLIHAVASRVVSGIVEQRYQAARGDLIFGDELTEDERVSPEAEGMAAAAMELYRRQFFATRRASPPAPSEPEAEPYRRMLLGITDGRLPVARANQIREQIQRIWDEICAAGEHDDGVPGDGTVPVSMLIGYFSPERAPD